MARAWVSQWATEEEMREQCERMANSTGGEDCCTRVPRGFCDKCWFQTSSIECVQEEKRSLYARAMLEGKLVLIDGELCFVEEG